MKQVKFVCSNCKWTGKRNYDEDKDYAPCPKCSGDVVIYKRKKPNSNRKGKNGEREFAILCRNNGYDNVKRGQQYNGLEGDDVVNLLGIHIEVKRVEKLNIDDAMLQSIKDRKGNIPIVAHRKNNHEFLITMRAQDWFNLYREWEISQREFKNIKE